MDVLAWLRCFRIKRSLKEVLRRARLPGEDAERLDLHLFKDRYCWTLLAMKDGQEVMEIESVPGPRAGVITVRFRGGPPAGHYRISKRHPAFDAVFDLTRAERDLRAARNGLN